MKIAIFPCSKNNIELIYSFFDNNHDHDVKLIGVKGYIQKGDDISIINNGYRKNVFLDDDIDKAIDLCDSIYFLEHDYKNLSENVMFEKCSMALKKGKKVFITYSFSPIKKQLLEKMGVKYKNKAHIFKSQEIDIKEIVDKKNNIGLLDINIPIIYVGKETRLVNSDYIFINLCQELKREGYKVAAITEDLNNAIIGCKVIDIKNTIKENSSDTSVLALNMFFKSMENSKQYDVIVLQLNEAATKFTNAKPEGFGIEQYIISLSAVPDYYIHCMLCEKMELINDYINDLSNKFGYKIDAVCMNNISLDCMKYYEVREMSLNYCDSEEIDRKYHDYFDRKNIFYGQSEDLSELIYNDIIDKIGG